MSEQLCRKVEDLEKKNTEIVNETVSNKNRHKEKVDEYAETVSKNKEKYLIMQTDIKSLKGELERIR